MPRRMKCKQTITGFLIEKFIIIIIGVVGFTIVGYLAQNGLYKMGAAGAIKGTKECNKYTDAYVAEMYKGKEGHPTNAVEEAKLVGCSKF